MTKLLETLGGKLAERWLQLLVLPGALYLVVAVAAVRYGVNTSALTRDINALAASPATRNTGTILVVLIGLAAGAALVGIVVRALGSLVERIWLADAHRSVTRVLTRRRLRRWQAADERYRTALLAAGRAHVSGSADAPELARKAERLALARNRVGLTPPRRVFWLGDRIGAADLRVLSTYHLDLASAWPRLWLVIPEESRLVLQAARAEFASSTRLVAWGVAYFVLGFASWPLFVAGAATVVAGWLRGRGTGTTFADLVESTVDVHGRNLAAAMGVECPEVLTPQAGEQLTSLLRKES
ncbi:hypothetical protein KIPE111705_01090 [Kibdelosporangium persicum]|uniref:Vegetative cell wall protein gp1 n=1 Tax=Kibdelosporangium persicum TaxID=2698649 RepID=A0ABX2F771_9PSEU|nr:hypothetical protein [Kibdelosporangium persicum]NRN67004.1 Vegetative cell wall protein gp1 [Kibdelosporangium persicum]